MVGMDESPKHQYAGITLEELRSFDVAGLRSTYRELFGAETHSRNREFLLRRIAWRLQAIAEGDLSQRARELALDLADDAEWRLTPPKAFERLLFGASTRDPRLPQTGAVLRRDYNGQTIIVTVLEDGFEWQQRRYRSLTAVAFAVTNVRWNGFLFFGLIPSKRGRRG